MRVCRSPWLIAAYHGLHRLCVPRHPPHAIARLTTKDSASSQVAPTLPPPLDPCIQAEHARIVRLNHASTSFTSEHSKLASALQHQLFLHARDFPNPRSTISFRCQIALTQTPPCGRWRRATIELDEMYVQSDYRNFSADQWCRLPTQNPLRR